jgi:hypothetical protein
MQTTFKFIGNFTIENMYHKVRDQANSIRQAEVVAVTINTHTHPEFFTQKRVVKKAKAKELEAFFESLKSMTIPDILATGAWVTPLHNDGMGYYSTSGDSIIKAESYTVEGN